jgi:hypothetical protein
MSPTSDRVLRRDNLIESALLTGALERTVYESALALTEFLKHGLELFLANQFDHRVVSSELRDGPKLGESTVAHTFCMQAVVPIVLAIHQRYLGRGRSGAILLHHVQA